MAAEIARVRAATPGAFGVNLFVPGHTTSEPAALSSYVGLLQKEATDLGAEIGPPRWDDDGYEAKLDVLLADPPPLVSFTFGCPSTDAVRALQHAGALVAITVTTPDEAVRAEQAGADALCLQGSEAGAHRGSFTNDTGPAQDHPLAALLARVRGSSDRPLIAAGGLGGPEDVAAVLAAGASQVQLGTAFLRCPESGAHPLYKAALGDPRFTATGRHPGLQRPPGPRPGERFRAGPRRSAGRLPRGEQRHATAPGCRASGRGRAADEPLCRGGISCGGTAPGR